jgi:hypothetical protein
MFGRVIACALVVLAAGCARESNDAVAAAQAAAQRAATMQGAAAGDQAGAIDPVSIPARTGRGFASLPDRGQLLAYPGNVVRQQGAYTWHRADLSEAYALHAIREGHLQVTAPDGHVLDFKYDRHIEHASGDWTWIGHRAGHELEQAVLTFGADAAFGSIAQPDKHPLRLTVRDGVSWLVETDTAKLADVIGKITSKPDFLLASRPRRSGFLARPGASASVDATGQTATATATATPQVDVVLGYTPGFATANNGNSGAVTRLNFLVDFANTAYSNSKLTGRVRLVATIAVSYPDNTSNNNTLEKLSGFQAPSTMTTPDPAFNALRAARETYGADLVSLVRKFQTPENEGCGLAWLLGGAKQGIDLNSGWDYLGYSVVGDGTDHDEVDGKNYYCEDHTLAHELGHNMGQAHDRETAKGDDGVLDNPDDYGVSDYSFGYKKGIGSAGFYDVMAYGDTGQYSNNIFSNPRVATCGSLANQVCGIAAGQPNAADASLSLSQTMPTVAAFRATAVNPPPPPPPPPPARILLRQLDANGNGKSDLLFFNHALDRLTTWFMSGVTRSSYSSTVADGNWHLVDTGDFNGDGKTDLLFDDAAAKRLVMGLSNGTSYSFQTLVNGYAAGTIPIGVADINGNGRADILLRNVSTGRVTIWYMSGATRISYNGYDVAASYEFVGNGDLNGDHLQDLLWTNSSRQFLLSTSQGTTFTTQTLALAYQSTYAAVGLQDVNGDGKSDILLASTDSTKLTMWYMNGASRISYNTQTFDPAYRLVGKGDFDGNHRGDLVMFKASTRQIKLLLSSGTSFSPAVLGIIPASGMDLMDVQ